jgi:ribosomal protein S18 acetylase RimI-like enzyme
MRSLKNVRYNLTAADPSELEKRYEKRDLRQKSEESRSTRDRQHGGAPDRVAGAAYREKRIEISEAIRPHWASLVAEVDNCVVGFVLGRAGEFEFGLPGTIAWIEIIGVDPAYRGQGIAQELVG